MESTLYARIASDADCIKALALKAFKDYEKLSVFQIIEIEKTIHTLAAQIIREYK